MEKTMNDLALLKKDYEDFQSENQKDFIDAKESYQKKLPVKFSEKFFMVDPLVAGKVVFFRIYESAYAFAQKFKKDQDLDYFEFLIFGDLSVRTVVLNFEVIEKKRYFSIYAASYPKAKNIIYTEDFDKILEFFERGFEE